MTDLTAIKYEPAGEVATITLNRPHKLNALTDQLNVELKSVLSDVAEDPSVKVVVLTGEGKAFSAGYDVSPPADGQPRTTDYWRHHFSLAYATLRQIWSQPQPVIAKVRGACVGGGFSLSVVADLTYASTDAYFGDPEIKFGDGGHLFPLLQWMMGMKKLNELQLTGRFMGAQEALALGIVNEVVAQDALDGRVERIVRHMCLLPAGTLRANKANTRRLYDLMRLDEMATSREAHCVESLSSRAPSEFSMRAKSAGLSAALRWQKARFDEVGAFPSVSAGEVK